MILITDLGNNISVSYNGDNLLECRRFIRYMIDNKAYKKLNSCEWIISKEYLKGIQDNFETELLKHPWDDIGEDMKLKPYPYQKESIYYTLINPTSLLILPPGSGKKNNIYSK